MTAMDPVEQSAMLSEAEQIRLIRKLPMPILRGILAGWWAHQGQEAPDGKWRTWLMLAGRGFGKTRAAAEWVSELARNDGSLRIALVGATLHEVARVMVLGDSGLKAVARPEEDLLFYPSRGLVEFASGAQAFCYSGRNPEGLRGPQHHYAWCDELAKWRYPDEAWSNLMLGLRLREDARTLVTTTPRPIRLLGKLIVAPETMITRGRTADNDSLPEDFVAAMTALYGGTRLGRQELDGELIEDFEGALWTRAMVEAGRSGAWAPASAGELLKRIAIGVDPPASAGGDECGIVVCGLDAAGVGHVLDDRSAGGLSPEGWARAVVRAAADWGADLVIAETNQGGEMVESVLRSVDSLLPVRAVRARYGKGRRAEPVSALFARGKAKLAGAFPVLEDQMCGMTSTGYEGPGRSPDRADAMVWAMAELMLGEVREPRIRRL
jgi:phage terminase large subunit-like protein